MFPRPPDPAPVDSEEFRRWFYKVYERENTEYRIDIRQEGARGDGSTDDLLPIKSAILRSRAMPYPVPIYIPPGNYKLSAPPPPLTTGQVIYGESRGLSTFTFDQCDGFTFSASSVEDGDISLSKFSIVNTNNTSSNTSKAINLTGCNNARVYEVDVDYFEHAIYMQRGSGDRGDGCYWQEIEKVRARYCKHAVEINDTVNGRSCNGHTYRNVRHIDNGTWSGGITFLVSGYGHLFDKCYGGGYTGPDTAFVKFLETDGVSSTGNLSFRDCYVESGSAYGLWCPTGFGANNGLLISTIHWDTDPTVAKFSPEKLFTILHGNMINCDVVALRDGITAPSAVTDRALQYVDSGTGDLTEKYGDGTTKTIVADT